METNTQLQLIPFKPSHFPTLTSWIASEEELVQFAGPTFQYPLTPEQLASNLADPKRQAFALVEPHNSCLVGHGEIYQRGIAGLFPTYCSSSKKREGLGNSFGTGIDPSVKASYDNQEIRLKVYDWNSAAIHVYQHLGFQIDPAVRFESPVGGKNLGRL